MPFLSSLLRLSFGNIIHRAGGLLDLILILGGIYALRFDAREMALKKLVREEKLIRVLGWIQLSLGLGIWLVTKLVVFLI
jgi:hypothetical protein